MFDNLSNRLDGIVKRLRGKGRLTEADVDEVMKEIRAALLEADVNLTVVRSVCNRIREHAIGATRSQALDPGQQVVKAVHDELIRILGGETLNPFIHHLDGVWVVPKERKGRVGAGRRCRPIRLPPSPRVAGGGPARTCGPPPARRGRWARSG